jgi:hypothetical protein
LLASLQPASPTITITIARPGNITGV